MIAVDVYRSGDEITRFDVQGHAGFADLGQDIVCSAVSVLVINAVNSCEVLLSSPLEVKQASGRLLARITEPELTEVQLLLRSMVFGIEQIATSYPEHVRLVSHHL
jgi:uncharacterized protein YsxB (DUF464 family)